VQAPAPPPDTVAPVLSAVRLEPRRIRRARQATISAARSARLSFRLSEPARVTLTYARRTCRSGACRFVAARSRPVVQAGAGLTERRITGRLGRSRLALGTHRITLRPVDAAGNRGRARHVTLRVVRR
jgi:hypothetical protein